MTGKGLTNLKGALKSEFFLLNYRKNEFWMMWQTDQRKNMLKNFLYSNDHSLLVWIMVFIFCQKNDEIFVSTFRMRANRLIDL